MYLPVDFHTERHPEKDWRQLLKFQCGNGFNKSGFPPGFKIAIPVSQNRDDFFSSLIVKTHTKHLGNLAPSFKICAFTYHSKKPQAVLGIRASYMSELSETPQALPKVHRSSCWSLRCLEV